MNRPRSRRDFLLDSGGITALVRDASLLSDYITIVSSRYDGSLLVPTPVLAEVRTGDRRIDVLTDRLINALGGAEAHLDPTAETWNRAGELRTAALRDSHADISTTDAVIVALAEERSFHAGVTIITGDRKDMELLVDLTGRRNISVDAL